MDGQKKLGLLIGAFVMILISVAFFQNINNTVSQTQLLGIANESGLTISQNTVTLKNTPVNSLISVDNGSITYTIGVDANFTRNGTLTVTKNLAGSFFNTTGPFTVKYNYEGANYITDGSSRTIAGLIPLFIALAIMSIGVGMAYMALRDEFGNFL